MKIQLENCTALHDFNEFLASSTDVKKEFENCSIFFMISALYDLLHEYVVTCDLILESRVILTMTYFSSTLLRIPPKVNMETLNASAGTLMLYHFDMLQHNFKLQMSSPGLDCNHAIKFLSAN